MIADELRRLLQLCASSFGADAAWCRAPSDFPEPDVSTLISTSADVKAHHVAVCDDVIRSGETSVVDNTVTSLSSLGDDEWSTLLGVPATDQTGAVVAVVVLANRQSRTWTAADLASAVDAASIAAALISHDRELGEERRRLDRERRARTVRREMYDLARQAASADTADRIAIALASGVRRVLGCQLSIIALPDEAGGVRFFHGDTVPDAVAADWVVVEPSTPVPLVHALVATERVELPDRTAMKDWPLLDAEADRSGIDGFAAYPIVDDRGNAMASLGVGTTEHAPLTPAQQAVIDELIVDSAAALQRARTAQTTRAVARELQRSLLPPALPQLDFARLATYYESSERGIDVGGDWYDVIALGPDVVGLVVGDAAGHDIRSAAVMGQVRHVLASHLRHHRSPADALTQTDEYFAAIDEAVMATAVVMVLDRNAATLTVACAGHPAPVVVEGDRAHSVALSPGAPIGSGFGAMADHVVSITDSTRSVIAFTDGLYERPGGDVVAQLAQLVSELDDACQTEGGVDALLRHRSTNETEDDATALVVELNIDRQQSSI